MNKIRYYGIAALLVTFLVVPMISAGDEAGPVTLTGVVTIHEETDEGEISSVYLAETEHGNVLIAKNGLWEELLDYVDEEIKATGTLSKADLPMFSHVIDITSFSSTEDE